jgi:hypothetical protein
MNDMNDKMCILHLEYQLAKATFNVFKKCYDHFTDFFIAEAWVSKRVSHSSSSSRQLWFFLFSTPLDKSQKQKN